ncbi:hypothetical protein M422DRAFT_777164 [Sphaerobolus stellatus SS14]|nr:hypothetical protein M422DRAFT_777164 [Sphaerobolus stellatus SS14]
MPFPTPVHHSLDEVDPESIIRKGYPKDFLPNPQTVRFPQGKSTYWLFGPEDGKKVVLIHGISTPSIMWKDFAPWLAGKGFRILVYDLYGRGYSEAPDTTYDVDLFITQLVLLFQHVEWSNADIIGFSMGGGIAAAYASIFPKLVSGKVIFVASAGLMAGVPKEMSDAAVNRNPDLTSYPVGPEDILPRMRALQRQSLPGFVHALKSSFRDGPIRDMDSAFEMLSLRLHTSNAWSYT